MIVPRRLWNGIVAGEVDLAFRRWKRPTVRAGGTLHTGAGVLAIDALDVIAPEDTTVDADVLARLAALDRRRTWTRAVLELIERRPATLAADLAVEHGQERLAFKADVRRLKALGLTESLKEGYRLSPRGEAVLAALRSS